MQPYLTMLENQKLGKKCFIPDKRTMNKLLIVFFVLISVSACATPQGRDRIPNYDTGADRVSRMNEMRRDQNTFRPTTQASFMLQRWHF